MKISTYLEVEESPLVLKVSSYWRLELLIPYNKYYYLVTKKFDINYEFFSPN